MARQANGHDDNEDDDDDDDDGDDNDYYYKRISNALCLQPLLVQRRYTKYFRIKKGMQSCQGPWLK